MPTMIRTYSDADWAGCKATRKSTIGGCIMVGNHNVKGWSKTQTLVALSSGESELYAILKAAAETLGIHPNSFARIFFLRARVCHILVVKYTFYTKN